MAFCIHPIFNTDLEILKRKFHYDGGGRLLKRDIDPATGRPAPFTPEEMAVFNLAAKASAERAGILKDRYFADYLGEDEHGDPLAGGELRRLRGTGNRWEYDHNRRAAKAKMSQVSGETAEYVKILRRDPCAYCGAPCEHIDHIIPFADGGITEWINLAPACAACNHRKSRQALLTFLLGRIAA